MTALVGALGGGDTVEIIVALRNLTGAGFAKLDAELKGLGRSANSVNLSGASRGVKTLEKDAEAAAGSSGGGGIAGLAAAASGLVGPLILVGGAMAGAAVVGDQIVQTYEKVEQQEKQLAIAAKDHGIAVKAEMEAVDASIPVGEKYGYTADQTREALTKLAEAGFTVAQQQGALPHIFDLARAKQIDLGEATDAYTRSVFGNARALKQYGIILPPVTASSADVGKATAAVTIAENNLKTAQEKLTLTEEQLRKKHKDHTADAFKLQQAQDKVTTAEEKLKSAQEKLTLAQQGGINRGDRLKLVNDGLQKAVGGQAGSVTNLQKMQARLNDSWEHFATTVGPALETAFSGLLGILSSFLDVLNNIAGAIGNVVNAVTHSGPLSAAAQRALAGQHYRGHAEGGWVGLNGPEVAIVGEKGPEYIVPNDRIGRSGPAGSLTVNFHSAFPPSPQMARDLVDAIEGELARRFSNQSTSALMGVGGV